MITLLDVTQDDIRQGRPRNSRLCPIALAAARAFPDATLVSAGYDHVYVTNGVDHTNYVYKTNGNARAWQHDFDMDIPVEPTTVKLELIDTWRAS